MVRYCFQRKLNALPLSSYYFQLTRTSLQRLAKDGLLKTLSHAIAHGETEYSVSNLGVPGLRHFVYKSRSHVQVTMPMFEDPYDKPIEKRGDRDSNYL